MHRPTLFVAGADIGDRTIWTWQWSDDSPQHRVVESSDVSQATADLAAALPDPPRGPALEKETASAAATRCLTGPFSTVQGERTLTRRLANRFLPEAMAREIRERCQQASPGLFRVLPPPSSYAIPWELLPVEGSSDRRLIELMDVVQVAPPLTRDGTLHRPSVPNALGENAFRVVDPKGQSPVMAPIPGLLDDRHHELYRWELDEFWQDWTPEEFIDELAARRPTKLLWVGHVATAKDGTAALQLTAKRQLSAAMLFGRPDVADSSDASRELSMPARVGLVACRSGADFVDLEPFGLVVACLERGAEFVTATRWSLPTDHAFFEAEKLRRPALDKKTFCQNGPFNAAAHAVDNVLNSDDPIHALGDWQREKLNAWRTHGRLVDSPIIWASIANYHAPYRTVESADEPA